MQQHTIVFDWHDEYGQRVLVITCPVRRGSFLVSGRNCECGYNI